MTTTTQTPHNPLTGKDFTRGNATRLVEAEIEAGYPTSEWATYRQWFAAGRQVRKGEQGTKCLLPKVQRTEDGTETATGRIVRGFHVFNIAQTESID